MHEIYRESTYILAVLELHREYLMRNIANSEAIEIIGKYGDIIYKNIFSHISPPISENENKEER